MGRSAVSVTRGNQCPLAWLQSCLKCLVLPRWTSNSPSTCGISSTWIHSATQVCPWYYCSHFSIEVALSQKQLHRLHTSHRHLKCNNSCIVLHRFHYHCVTWLYGKLQESRRGSYSETKNTWRMVSSGMLRRVALVRTDVSEEPSASFIRVARIGELGTTLAATSNRRTLRASVASCR
jgi:hypothetical protein